MSEHHWGYGSGMVGCLYDNGPCFVETREQAIDGVLFPFEDNDEISEDELSELRNELEACGTGERSGQTVYFRRKTRPKVGADLLEIWRVEGPCPESED